MIRSLSKIELEVPKTTTIFYTDETEETYEDVPEGEQHVVNLYEGTVTVAWYDCPAYGKANRIATVEIEAQKAEMALKAAQGDEKAISFLESDSYIQGEHWWDQKKQPILADYLLSRLTIDVELIKAIEQGVLQDA